MYQHMLHFLNLLLLHNNFDLECHAISKNCMLKMILMHHNLATNARIVFKLSSLLMNTLTYHVSKTLNIYEYT